MQTNYLIRRLKYLNFVVLPDLLIVLKFKSNLKKVFSVNIFISLKKIIKKPFYFYQNHRKREIALESAKSELAVNNQITISHGYFNLPNLDELYDSCDNIIYFADKILTHKFNLLGSGEIDISKTKKETDDSWSEKSKYILKQIQQDYKQIDWQKDFKSGFCWDSKTWHKDIKYGSNDGVDIKSPWELGRMNHLPILALAAVISNKQKNEESTSNKYLSEFKNQILDFICHNLSGFGGQWMNSMDVAIRAVNWLVSYDIIKSAGINLDDKFQYYFVNSIYEHGKFIKENPEWSEGMRGNHYLTGIVGLLIISLYLNDSKDSNKWFEYSINELSNELKYQFNYDGSNFESSTSYHCFTVEMIIFAVYFIWKVKPDIIIKSIKDKLIHLLEFTYSIINNNGEIPQFGDNDSGRFINFMPLEKNWSFLKNLINGRQIFPLNLFNIDFIKYVRDLTNKFENKEWQLFKDFGLYYHKNHNYTCFVRCGRTGQKGKGGHGHNDVLSFVLFVNDMEIFTDPGTFTYTSDWNQRNLFRSSKMHNTLVLNDLEQNEFYNYSKDDLFWLFEKAKAKILTAEKNIFSGEHIGYGEKHKRTFNFEIDRIKCKDECHSKSVKRIYFHLKPELKSKIESNSVIIEPNNWNTFKKNDFENFKIELIFSGEQKLKIEKYFYSPEYGVKIEAEKIIAETMNDIINWEIKMRISE